MNIINHSVRVENSNSVMRVICAWHEITPNEKNISHGICDRCVEAFLNFDSNNDTYFIPNRDLSRRTNLLSDRTSLICLKVQNMSFLGEE